MEPMQNLWGASTGFRRKICITSDLWKHCRTSAAACRTSACGTSAEPLPAGPLYRTSAEPLQNLCGTSTEPLRHLYGTYAEPLRHLYGSPPDLRQRVQNLCMRDLCGTNLYGTFPEPMLYRGMCAEPVRDLLPTFSAPPQKLCHCATSKPGTPERQNLCGTFPPPPQLLADPNSLQNLLSMELCSALLRNLSSQNQRHHDKWQEAATGINGLECRYKYKNKYITITCTYSHTYIKYVNTCICIYAYVYIYIYM